jgi:DNA-binding LacI/PurR family transcriptional regulator
MAVTIRDVAKAAGVSPMAVSKVLHGRGGNVRVSEVRAEHIRKIAQELNYTPNQLARILGANGRKILVSSWIPSDLFQQVHDIWPFCLMEFIAPVLTMAIQ